MDTWFKELLSVVVPLGAALLAVGTAFQRLRGLEKRVEKLEIKNETLIRLETKVDGLGAEFSEFKTEFKNFQTELRATLLRAQAEELLRTEAQAGRN